MNTISSSQGYAGGGIVKTIILPNEEINRLGIQAEELRTHLSLESQLFEEAINGYSKDKMIRESEFRLKQEDFEIKIKELKERVKEREEIYNKLSKDYFVYKHLVNKTK